MVLFRSWKAIQRVYLIVSKKNPAKQRFRSDSSLRRSEGQREPRPSILIVCEGSETEPRYFEALRRQYKLSTITVAGGRESFRNLVENALSLREQRRQQSQKSQKRGEVGNPEFDQVWCVFDTESQALYHQCIQAVDYAEQEGLEVAISNPCIEYWYILHFEETTRPFMNGEEAKQWLRRYIQNYEENTSVFELIRNNTDIAIERAERIYNRHPDGNLRFPNPSTCIYKLVRIMKLL